MFPDKHPLSSISSRRRFLKAAAAGTILAASTPAYAQQPSTFKLDGNISGWTGRSPDAIAGQANPTLSLEAGTTYRITWTNIDGLDHNIALLDSNESVLKRTKVVSGQGVTQTLEFTATQEMTEYLCEVHPTSMRGEINVSGGEQSSTPTSTSTDAPSEKTSTTGFMPTGPSVRLETVVDGGLTAPLDLQVQPDSDNRVVVDQVGAIYNLSSNGLSDEPFLDISNQLVNFDNLPEEKVIDERGLLGFAFHPEFQETRKFYVYYSAPPRDETPNGFTHTQVLSEFRATEDGMKGVADSERTLLEIPQSYFTHNGGGLLFGPDGLLYLGVGNGGGDLAIRGNVNDWYRNRGGNGQDVIENLLGSILRIDVNNREEGKPYAIPDDNPLVDEEGLDEQFAWGFRNPWRMSFGKGNLFVSDVGQFEYEEISIVANGGNYGWNVKEASHCFASANLRPITSCPNHTPEDVRGGELLINPVIEYPHRYNGQGVGVAVTGGYIYQNATIPALRGKFVFGDYSKTGKPGGSVFAATPPREGKWPLEEVIFEEKENGRLDSYVLGVYPGPLGELFVLTTDNLGVVGETGAIHRVLPPKQETPTPAATQTPSRPPTATATPESTPTQTNSSTEVPANNYSPNPAPRGGSETQTSTSQDEGFISRVSGPGFGILTTLAALTSILARVFQSEK